MENFEPADLYHGGQSGHHSRVSTTSSLSPAAAGIIAGGCGILVGHPFDTLKVRMQVGKHLNISKNYSRLQILKQLYRGIIPPLLTSGLMQSINFSLYEAFKQQSFLQLGQLFHIPANERSNHTQLYLASVFTGGTLAGSVISLIATPISLIKVQQQVATSTGVISVATNIYSKYGILRFYRGLCSMFVMESYGRGVYLLTYEVSKLCYPIVLNHVHGNLTEVKEQYPSPSSSSISITTFNEASLLVKIMAASTAGCVSWLSIYPFDVIKSRMQLDISGQRFNSCIDCFFKTISEGGIKYLFRGLSYTLIRAAPVAATVLPIYEYTKEFFDRQLVGAI